MLDFHLNKTRSGEWGDHVTLQAAADSVWFLFFIFLSFPWILLIFFFFFFFLIWMLERGKFSIIGLSCAKAHTYICVRVYTLSWAYCNYVRSDKWSYITAFGNSSHTFFVCFKNLGKLQLTDWNLSCLPAI